VRKNCLYRHINNTTVALEVEKAFFIKERAEWSLRVVWWNIGACHDPWPLGISQRIRIPAAAVRDWVPMPFSGRGPKPQHVVR
jgi:hypothetical protein